MFWKIPPAARIWVCKCCANVVAVVNTACAGGVGPPAVLYSNMIGFAIPVNLKIRVSPFCICRAFVDISTSVFSSVSSKL